MMDHTDIVARGVRAQQLLEDEVLTDALKELERVAVEALARADVSDHLSLMRHTAALQAARAVPEQLTSILTTGELAEQDAQGVGPTIA